VVTTIPDEQLENWVQPHMPAIRRVEQVIDALDWVYQWLWGEISKAVDRFTGFEIKRAIDVAFAGIAVAMSSIMLVALTQLDNPQVMGIATIGTGVIWYSALSRLHDDQSVNGARTFGYIVCCTALVPFMFAAIAAGLPKGHMIPLAILYVLPWGFFMWLGVYISYEIMRMLVCAFSGESIPSGKWINSKPFLIVREKIIAGRVKSRWSITFFLSGFAIGLVGCVLLVGLEPFPLGLFVGVTILIIGMTLVASSADIDATIQAEKDRVWEEQLNQRKPSIIDQLKPYEPLTAGEQKRRRWELAIISTLYSVEILVCFAGLIRVISGVFSPDPAKAMGAFITFMMIAGVIGLITLWMHSILDKRFIKDVIAARPALPAPQPAD
jgi:hypothetical protein